MPRCALAILAVMLLLTLASAANAFCSEPSAPACASRYGAFDDEWEFDRCKRNMADYKDEAENFIQCHAKEAEQARDKAVSEFNDAVQSFNRRARAY